MSQEPSLSFKPHLDRESLSVLPLALMAITGFQGPGSRGGIEGFGPEGPVRPENLPPLTPQEHAELMEPKPEQTTGLGYGSGLVRDISSPSIDWSNIPPERFWYPAKLTRSNLAGPLPPMEFAPRAGETATPEDYGWSSHDLAYDAAQKKIDDIEDRLVKQGVDIGKLAHPDWHGSDFLVEKAGYEYMPDNLAKAYNERDALDPASAKWMKDPNPLGRGYAEGMLKPPFDVTQIPPDEDLPFGGYPSWWLYQQGGEVVDPRAEVLSNWPWLLGQTTMQPPPYDPQAGQEQEEGAAQAEFEAWQRSKLGMDVEAARASGTFGIGDPAQYYVLPTQMQEGEHMDFQEALQRYYNTGQYLGGPFSTEEQAQAWEQDFLGYYQGGGQ
jgi:hypothetical protein